MRRREFIVSSGFVSVLGFSSLSSQSLGVDFSVSGVPDRSPSEVDSVVLSFDKLEISSKYLTSDDVDLFTSLEVGDYGSDDGSYSFSVSDGESEDFGGRVDELVVDGLEMTESVVECSVSVEVQYGEGSEQYNQSFNISEGDFVEASGGVTTETVIDGQRYRIHSFTDVGSGTFTVDKAPSDSSVDVLVVGGGGGGGYTFSNSDHGSGGGGAGGLIYKTGYEVVEGESIDVFVGSGGLGASQNGNQGEDGENSFFGSLTAIGGGGGGTRSGDEGGRDGGSGGGCSSSNGGGDSIQVSSEGVGIGSDGGGSTTPDGDIAAGAGGGGAVEKGDPGSGDRDTNDIIGGFGGDGKNMKDRFGTQYGEEINGDVYFAGGGGGGESTYSSVDTRAEGGNGGGGAGGRIGSRDGLDASSNTGGGGGGAAASSGTGVYTGGDGGSGIVLVRYPIE